MVNKEITRLDLAKGATTFKQGHYDTLAFTPRNADGEVVNLAGKDIKVVIVHGRAIVYDAPGTFDSADNTIQFSISENIGYGDMWMEITVTDPADPAYRQKFPTSEYDGKLKFIRSADDVDFVGFSGKTVAKFEELFNLAVAAVTEDAEVALARKEFTTLGQRLDAEQTKTNQRLEDTDGRINNIISTAGDGTTPTELVDIRTINGKTYATAGAAVRALSEGEALAKGAVSPEKTDFIQYGKNLFFKGKVALNTFFAGTQSNNIVSLNNYYVANAEDGILLKAGTSYTAYPIRAYTLTNIDGTFNTYANTGNDLGTAVITPTQDVYLRVAGKMENLLATQVEVGAVATVYEEPSLTIPLLKQASSTAEAGSVTVNKVDDKIAVRVPWTETEDFYTLWQYPNTFQNEGLNMMGVYTIDKNAPKTSLSGTLWKTSNDDIAPINGSPNNIGANHGYIYVDKITATAHGKTNFDIGSVWTIGGKNYVIIDIVDANSLLTIQEYTGVPSYPAQPLPSASGTLVHVNGATNTGDLVYTAKVYNQLYPSTNKKTLAIVVDGNEVKENGVYTGDKLEIVEKYDVTWVESVINYVKANGKKATKPKLNDDSIDGWFTVTNVFQHGRNGSITVQAGYEFLREFVNNNYGIVQSMIVGNKAYVPDVGAVAGLDMSTVVTQGTADLIFTKATWLSPTKPPYRYHQFNTDMTKGMALGYNTKFGVAKPARRQNDADAGKFQGSTKKMYPNVKIGGNFVKGDFEQAIAFRAPLQKLDAEATALYWYWVGNDVYLAFDYHVNVNKTVKLPNYLAGKKIEQLDIHPNATIQSEFVSSEGIKVKIINNYGYGVLRLYD